MKSALLVLFTLPLCLFSIASQAEKIVIKGEPIVIEKQNGSYVTTTTFPSQDYYYVNINNTNRVCYKEVQSSLEKIDSGVYEIRLGTDATSQVVKLHCYDFSPDYFVTE